MVWINYEQDFRNLRDELAIRFFLDSNWPITNCAVIFIRFQTSYYCSNCHCPYANYESMAYLLDMICCDFAFFIDLVEWGENY